MTYKCFDCGEIYSDEDFCPYCHSTNREPYEG